MMTCIAQYKLFKNILYTPRLYKGAKNKFPNFIITPKKNIRSQNCF